jgi:hypothetical protein
MTRHGAHTGGIRFLESRPPMQTWPGSAPDLRMTS